MCVKQVLSGPSVCWPRPLHKGSLFPPGGTHTRDTEAGSLADLFGRLQEAEQSEYRCDCTLILMSFVERGPLNIEKLEHEKNKEGSWKLEVGIQLGLVSRPANNYN